MKINKVIGLILWILVTAGMCFYTYTNPGSNSIFYHGFFAGILVAISSNIYSALDWRGLIKSPLLIFLYKNIIIYI